MPAPFGLPDSTVEKVLTNAKLERITTNTSKSVDVGQIVITEVSTADNKRVLRRIDYCIIPLMGLCYMLQFLDKLALSQGTLLGLRKDLHLEGDQYSWCSAIFYFGYLFWSWPSSYLIVKFPTGKYLAVSVFLWGIILMCHGATQNFAGLMVARFFLGIGEAAVAPGFGLITSLFYKRREQPLRQGAWWMGNSIANIFGGLIAYGVGNIKNPSLEHWRLLFLILGSVTTAYAIVLIIFLPDSPSKARFLNEQDRQVAINRTLENKTGFMDTEIFLVAQVWDALKDPQLWLLFLYTVSVNLANGGLTSFSGIVIAGFGFTDIKALLIQMPLGVGQLFFLILTSTLATLIPNCRLAVMIFNSLISMTGMIMVYALHGRAGRMAGLCLGSAFATNIPLTLSLVSSNVGGFTKRSVVGATIFIGYCVGNIAGPQFFRASEEPRYPTGIKASLAGLAFGAFFLSLLLAYYMYENSRRDKVYGPPQQVGSEEALAQELSSQTDSQLTTFRYVL